MNYSGIINCSIVDGNGFRVALFTSGCKHHCVGCHNKETWDFNCGKPYTEEVEKILFDRIDKPYIKGLTLTGGDPLYHYEDILLLLKRFRDKFGGKKDVWLYTGFTFDDVKKDFNGILNYVDYVVDGQYEEEKRDETLAFRGSSNQIIWTKNDGNEWVTNQMN